MGSSDPRGLYTAAALRRPAAMAVVAALGVLGLVGTACTARAPRGTTRFEAPCAEVLLLAARGSDAPIGSDEVTAVEAAFHSALQSAPVGPDGTPERVAEVVELGDLDRDGRLDPGGYPALAAVEAVGLDPTAVAAEGDLAVAGGWNESRRVGTEEVLRLLGEREADCPDERLVLVGYSMGATAIGVALGSLSEDVVDRVDAVVFLGDPTLVAGPWLRRSGPYPVAGLLGGRRPYVPATLAARTTSWCGAGDPYCTGNVALFLLDGFVPCGPARPEPLATACEQRHEDYPRWAVPAAMRDVVEGLRG